MLNYNLERAWGHIKGDLGATHQQERIQAYGDCALKQAPKCLMELRARGLFCQFN